MDRKVSNKAGRALYRKRQHLIEQVFGQIKDGRHIRRFMRRGKQASARVEAHLRDPQPLEALPARAR